MSESNSIECVYIRGGSDRERMVFQTSKTRNEPTETLLFCNRKSKISKQHIVRFDIYIHQKSLGTPIAMWLPITHASDCAVA